MRRTGNVPIVMCLWPGLPRLWFRGDWYSLFIAVGFGLLFNCTLVSTFVWPDIFQPQINFLLWSMTMITWSFVCWKAYQERDDLLQPEQAVPTELDPLFYDAQLDYLAGRFGDATILLEQILRKDSRDVEARLMLATIFRRRGKHDEAFDQLELLQKYDQSVKWRDEIIQELELVESEYDGEDMEENTEMCLNSGTMGISENVDIETIRGEAALQDDTLLETVGSTNSVSEQFSTKLESITKPVNR